MGAAKQAGRASGIWGFHFFFLTLIQRLPTLKMADSETSIFIASSIRKVNCVMLRERKGVCVCVEF